VKEIIWYASVIFLTLLQHETAVVLCYHRLFSYFHNHFSAALEAFLIVSLLDVFWLYLQFLVFRASLDKLSHVARIQTWLARIQLRRWFVRLKPYFVNDTEKKSAAAPSRFKRMVDRAGYFGILICAALPGPGFKEIAILMALTPRYRDHGFAVTYLGGLIKTILTLLIYAGLSHAVERLFDNFIR
jgi:uncharacterized membrane protein